MATITYNKMGPGEGMRPEVTPISVTHAELVTIRDAGNLIPGQFYLITDFVTTTMKTGTRSAGHPFDILVHAVSEKTLSEQAWAVKHDGDTYFDNARLEAWELKYRLDNVQWSQRACTIIEDKNDGYTASSMGTVDIDGETYILWDASEFTEDYGFTRLVSLSTEEGAEMWTYDPATGEKGEDAQTSIAAIVGEFTEDGKGTILWMKDEFGNECCYDFKNIQQKRWKVTDELGRSSLNGKYLGVLDYLPEKLSIEDESDFIWAYLYSVYNYAGGTQDTTDHSLAGKVHEMVTNFTVDSNNAFVWEEDYRKAYKCTFSGELYNSSFSGDVRNCSFSGELYNSSFSGNVYQNSFSGDVKNCSFSGGVSSCSFSGNVGYCSFSGGVSSCSFSGYVVQNTFSGNVNRNSFSGNVTSNSFSGILQNSIISGQLSNLQIKASSGTSGTINCLYTLGKIDGKTITVPTNAAYPTYAAMTTAGQLKTWNPAD